MRIRTRKEKQNWLARIAFGAYLVYLPTFLVGVILDSDRAIWFSVVVLSVSGLVMFAPRRYLE